MKKTFTGSGLNSSGLFKSINNAINKPAGHTLPAGATWPFASLKLNSNSVVFKMPGVSKNVSINNVKNISLSKYGYICR